MAFFYGVNSDNSASFFSSMLGSKSNDSMGAFYGSLADYASIKNGSYGKLVRAYYAQQEEETKGNQTVSKPDKTKTESVDELLSSTVNGGTVSASNDSNVTSAKKEAATIKTEANALKAVSSDLLEKGTKSIFNKIDVVNAETGRSEKAYDTEKIYKNVKSFVDDYNSLIADGSKTTNNSIMQKNASMMKTVDGFKSELSKVGITIDKDNKLSIDEDTFKKSDMLQVKNLFNSTEGMNAKMYQSVAEIENLANAATQTSYNSNAGYETVTGSLFNGYT